MTNPAEHETFDAWATPLDELAGMAREIGTFGNRRARDLSTVDARREFAAHILDVLQARSVLEAAELQRQAIEDQTKTSERLVHATWWLASVTAVLALAAVVALFIA